LAGTTRNLLRVSREDHRASCVHGFSTCACEPARLPDGIIVQPITPKPPANGAGISDLKMRRADLQSQIYDDEALKEQIEQQIETVRRRISQLADSVHRRVRTTLFVRPAFTTQLMLTHPQRTG
jgi:hypothetical protein